MVWTVLTALYWSSLDADLTTKSESEYPGDVRASSASENDDQVVNHQSAGESRRSGVYEGDDRGLRVYEDDVDNDDPTRGLL